MGDGDGVLGGGRPALVVIDVGSVRWLLVDLVVGRDIRGEWPMCWMPGKDRLETDQEA